MPDVADNLRSASTQISELGSLESSLSVDLAAQATKFDEAWATIDTNPEKSLKALAEQTTKLTTEANLADNDRAKDTARNFATDIQDLSRLRLELNAAKARKDQKSIDRLQAEYSTANYRARNTYEYWRRGDVEQYKLNLDNKKKKQQQAAEEVQKAIDALDREIGNEGNEQFTQLRAALQTVQSALKSGANTSNISLPGASKFDPKKGNFTSYFENWKRRNRIDEADLRKPNSTQKAPKKTEEEQDTQQKQQVRSARSQQRAAIKKQVEAANIQAKAAAIAAVSSGAVATGTAAAAATSVASTAAATSTEATATAQATPPSTKASPSTTKAPLEQEQQTQQPGRVEQKQVTQTTQTQAGTTARITPNPTTQRTIPTITSTPTPTEAVQKIEQQQLGRIAQRNEIRGSQPSTTTTTTTAQEITFTGKIGRRLEKNVAEFEQVKQRIIQIQAKMETKTVSDPELIQELHIQIEQAIQIRQALIGDATVQIETTLEQSPAQAAAVAAALVASIAGAVQFTTLAATAQANRADTAGLPVPQNIRIASKLNSSDIQGLEDLAQAASKATITTTTSGGKENFRIQSSADQTLKHLNQLIGNSALDGAAAEQVQQFSNPLQLKASAEGVHDAQRLASHAEQFRQAVEPQTPPSTKTSVDTDQDFELPSPEEAALAFQPIGQTAALGRKPGQLGTLPPKTRIGAGMASALALQSQQRAERVGLDRNRQDLLSDTGLSDSSILDDAGLEPVLRLYDRSYTDQQVPQISAPIAGGDIETGGGYIQSESDQTRRARELQQAQYQSRRSLVGGENTYLGLSAQNLAAIEAAAGLGGLRGQIGEDVSGYVLADRADRESDEQSLEGDEGDQARQLMSQQLAQMRQKALSDARKKLQDKIKNQIKATAKKAAQKSAAAATRVTVETAQAVAGPEDAGITWITLIIEMNLQLILKYVLKGFGFIGSQAIKADRENGIEGNIVQEVNDFADSIQTFWEDVLTIWMDCCLQIASCIQMCGPFILIILSFILFFGGSLFGALEIFNSFSTK